MGVMWMDSIEGIEEERDLEFGGFWWILKNGVKMMDWKWEGKDLEEEEEKEVEEEKGAGMELGQVRLDLTY